MTPNPQTSRPPSQAPVIPHCTEAFVLLRVLGSRIPSENGSALPVSSPRNSTLLIVQNYPWPTFCAGERSYAGDGR